GLAGMPRSVHTSPAKMGGAFLNLIASTAGFVQALGSAVFVTDVVTHARGGAIAPSNPRAAGTLEWATPTPAPSYNFASIPDAPLLDPVWRDPGLPEQIAQGRLWLGGPSGGRRLTLSTDTVSATPESVIVLPG